jgi:hypothetical protein
MSDAARYCFIHYPKGSSGASAPRENAAEAWVAFADRGHKKMAPETGAIELKSEIEREERDES